VRLTSLCKKIVENLLRKNPGRGQGGCGATDDDDDDNNDLFLYKFTTKAGKVSAWTVPISTMVFVDFLIVSRKPFEQRS
jgi:hypothetical protein